MDITNVFKASVKTVNLRNKALGDSTYSRKKVSFQRKQSFITSKAKNILNQISNLYQLLKENQKAYLNYLGTKQQMSNVDRDRIDFEAEKIIIICSQMIKDLKNEIYSLKIDNVQHQEHQQVIVILMENYLSNVSKIHSEEKSNRVKRAIELSRIAKLGPISKNTLQDKAVDLNESVKSLQILEMNGDLGSIALQEDELPSKEDIQIFEEENEQLLNELNLMEEEVKEIGNKVIQISELQKVFSEKILDQDKMAAQFNMTTVNNTENMQLGNEQVRQAIQRNAGLRVWKLFVVFVLAFTLLFLDWYNS